MKHSPEVTNRATKLYFDIEKHILLGGMALTMREINKLLGLTSSASAQCYVKILSEWGLIHRIPFGVRTITLAKTNYPPVEWRHIELKGESKHA